MASSTELGRHASALEFDADERLWRDVHVARGREGRARVTSAPDWWAGYVKVSPPLRVR